MAWQLGLPILSSKTEAVYMHQGIFHWPGSTTKAGRFNNIITMKIVNAMNINTPSSRKAVADDEFH
jgi:hypothetical protein